MRSEENDWQRRLEFHGHSCPGLAIGFRACEAARERLKLTFCLPGHTRGW